MQLIKPVLRSNTTLWLRLEIRDHIRDNSNEYTLGDTSELASWVSWKLSKDVDGTAKMKFREVGRITGQDEEMNANMSPAADASNYGGRRADIGFAVVYETAQMTSLGFDFNLPVYQNLFGPQMKTEWIAGVNLGYMF